MNIPQKPHWFPKSRTRGSALLVVVLLCAFTLIMVGSYMRAISTQSKLSYRTTLQSESRNAAEGVAEYALAELHRRSKANPSFGAGNNPNALTGYTLTSGDKNFLAPGGANNHVVLSSLEFKNSVLSDNAGSKVEISNIDPVNKDNPSFEKTLLGVRSMELFAKATVRDPLSNKDITSYISEIVQIADETWLNYAIFYNMDLEFHAGPDFTVYGPVHSNANIYATSGATLKFYSSLTAVKNIFRYDKYTGKYDDHKGDVYCSNKSGMLDANLYTMSGNPLSPQDSRNPSFKTDAPARWDVFVKDSTLGTEIFKPSGMLDYVPEDFSLAGIQLRNNAYVMIEPQLSSTHNHTDTYTGINDYGHKGDSVENMKFSALSGFVIQIKPPNLVGTTADYVDTAVTPHKYYHSAPQWRLVCYKATDPSQRLSADNPPERDADGLPKAACIIDPFTDEDDVDYPSPSTQAKIKRSLKVALLNAIIAIPYRDGGTTPTIWGDGNSNLSQYTQTAPLNIATGTACTGAAAFTTALNTAGYYPIYDRREGHDYTTAGGDTMIPMKGAMHVLRIDLGKLNALLTDTTGLWQKPYGSASYVYNPATDYTGVVYVQLPLTEPDATLKARFPLEDPVTFGGYGLGDSDRIRPAVAASPAIPAVPDTPAVAEQPAVPDQPAVAPIPAVTYKKGPPVRLAKPAVPGTPFIPGHPAIPATPFIPGHPAVPASPGYAVLLSNAGTVPQIAGSSPPDGFTVATNGPLYIWGHYNADGNSGTGSATTPDSTSERPALLAADAITVLSAKTDFSFQTMATTTGSTSSFTEISASIITGLVPTQKGKDEIWSGGVHNLVRLLENWGSTYRYRGSIAALFESEVAKGAYHENHNGAFYGAPTRQMGYHEFLGKGRFPPATPIVRTVRRMNLKDITKAQYDAGPTKPPAYNP